MERQVTLQEPEDMRNTCVRREIMCYPNTVLKCAWKIALAQFRKGGAGKNAGRSVLNGIHYALYH